MRVVFFASILTLGIVGLAIVEIPRAQAQSAEAATASQTATFTIENMTCALCPVTVCKALEGVSGVKSVSVDFDQKTATVVFDPRVIDAVTIAAASTDAGYPAHAAGQ
jgi:mercuric ion binding protein